MINQQGWQLCQVESSYANLIETEKTFIAVLSGHLGHLAPHLGLKAKNAYARN
jgi:hypothetical protein